MVSSTSNTPPVSNTTAAPSITGISSYVKSDPGQKVAKKDIDQMDFLHLLTTQLKQQDPLNPQSDTDFAAQMAQFSGLQQMQKLNQNISKQQSLQQMSSAAALIGKNVVSSQTDASGKAISGLVTSVTVEPSGDVNLSIGKESVPISKVTGISQVSN
jgi:flagellar basal-body rod modification protein FlgD